MSDRKEKEAEIDISGKNMWNHQTLNFLQSNLNDSLIRLDLSTNHLSYESVELLSNHLKNSKNLQYLCIIQTQLIQRSSVLLFESIGHSNLIELIADDNIFPTEPCKALAASLELNPPLELLSLNGCDIPDEGVVALAKSLPKNKNLKHLRLESNSMFSVGAQALGDVLPESHLLSLCIADNQIWNEGTFSIITNLDQSHLTCLDLGYNIVDLKMLSEKVAMSKVSQLGLSGCKVNEQQLLSFLSSIPSLNLETLIMDGFSKQMLPISWPRVHDNIWGTRTYFDCFLNSLKNSPKLSDLRIGFFDLEQIFTVNKALEGRTEELTISFHDFGRTDDIWLLKLPGPRFESPTTVFRWNDQINTQNCHYIGQIILNTKVNDKDKIETLDFHELHLDNSVFSNIIHSLKDFPIRHLNLNDNNLNDESLEILANYLKQIKLSSLDLRSNSRITDDGCYQFIQSIKDKSIFPRKIYLNFRSTDMGEYSKHKMSEAVAEIVKENFSIELLSISGPLTVADALEIVSELKHNSHIREIEFSSEHTKIYANPDPELKPDLQENFISLVNVLHDCLFSNDSVTKLRVFNFPLLSEIYLYHDDIYEKWIEITERLKSHHKSSSSRKDK
ncbi:hypothetical protein TRFO_31120 [Tritrichomonas foetus]|uniref:Leucine Rich Repeat family protein n=1 Tax=Tritrichomonas foetus TaxID=1144522 RepID=A0A1J4JSA0_9EUKA|nr:hypothetical protein TRFO_31120 [Tritrichomonas foetus]|eukprot:OHT01931.1 hypothetical protein TRFO_31120 [Tritrichomonas foetus]